MSMLQICYMLVSLDLIELQDFLQMQGLSVENELNYTPAH